MESLNKLLVADVMHDRLWDLPLVKENETVKMVIVILVTRGYVWVVDNNEKMNLIGVITEHDVLNLLEIYDKQMTAKHLAKKNVITCASTDTISDVIQKIKKHKVRRIPVVEKGKLIGEITLCHLLEKVYSILG